uniref:Uncharacterized protein n=1 Tax=Ananas comosus var. bracteatus TaxID=296719 RepID=A0A6V7PR62_ANACO|nr:unnamed protein product [Ananas comosus var. bracteatus]
MCRQRRRRPASPLPSAPSPTFAHHSPSSPSTPLRLRSPPPFGTPSLPSALCALASARSPPALLASNPTEAAPRSSFFSSPNLLHQLRGPSRPTSTSTSIAANFSSIKPTSRNPPSSPLPATTKRKCFSAP